MSGDRPYALRYSALCVKDVEGWLVKEGRSLRARRSRYVRLRGATLSSHRNKTAPPSWELCVTNATVARGPAHEWHILLDLPNRHVSLIAPARADFEEWIYALRRASLFSSRVEDYYRVRHIVGEGMNGKVRLGNDLITDETVAIKTVPRLGRANEDDFLAREVQIMLSMDHPNIVRTFDIFVRRKRIHFVMEYVPGGELFDLVAANTIFTEPRAASVMADLLRAIQYLHARGIAHRDVKLENLLCMRNTWPLQVKLADFGFANHVRAESDKILSSFVGTPYYIAPEMLLSKGHGRPVDIWACGVVMYILLSGKFPFGGETEKEYYSRVLSREAYFPSQEWASVSPDAKDLVAAMLHKDPSKRLTADQCLAHPWMLNAMKKDEPTTLAPSKYSSTPAPAPPAASPPLAAAPAPQEGEKDRPASLLAERFRRNRSKIGKARGPGATNLAANPNRRSRKDLGAAPAPPPPQPPAAAPPAPAAPAPKMRTSPSRQKLLSTPSRRKLASVASRAKLGDGAPCPQRECSPPPLPATEAVLQRESNAARPGGLAGARASGNLAGRRHSLIRRLLSSTRASLDRYETRHASFSGADGPGADADDEASAVPRKTISLFGKLAPIRRSFHRGRGSAGAGADDALGGGSAGGGLGGLGGGLGGGSGGAPFVNSQTQPGAQRLPPKLAREALRAAAQERKAARRPVFRFRRGSTAGSSLSGSVASSSGPPSAPGTPGLRHASKSTSRVASDASRARSDSTTPAAAAAAAAAGAPTPPRHAPSAEHADATAHHAARALGHHAAPRVVSDATSLDRVVSDNSDRPRGSWPGSAASLPRRARALARAAPDGDPDAPPRDKPMAPLSAQQMSIILGYDDDESNGSLQPSSGSTFGAYQWAAACKTADPANRLPLSAQMMSR